MGHYFQKWGTIFFSPGIRFGAAISEGAQFHPVWDYIILYVKRGGVAVGPLGPPIVSGPRCQTGCCVDHGPRLASPLLGLPSFLLPSAPVVSFLSHEKGAWVHILRSLSSPVHLASCFMEWVEPFWLRAHFRSSAGSRFRPGRKEGVCGAGT